MIVKVRMKEEEKEIAEEYARHIGMSLSDAMKRIYFEKIEEEYDIILSDVALNAYEKSLRLIR